MYQNQNTPFTSDPSSNPSWMLDHHMMLMVQAEANKDWWKRWIYFCFIMKRLTPYIEPGARKLLEEDHKKFLKCQYEIENSDDQSKPKLLEDLRNNYIESHMGYISLTMPRAGIITMNEDAELNIENQEEYEVIKRIVREQAGGLPSGIAIAKSVDRSKGEKEVKPDEGT